ncbi:MAG: hypothetical protein ISR55_09000 [Bacteroidetes bacterium]|nr:hypothetical protein [Bacteroidota bacterium]
MKNKFDISKIRKSGNFQVPESYFDRLPSAILDRIHHRKQNSRFSGKYVKLAIAASILIVAGLIVTKFLIDKDISKQLSSTEEFFINQVDSDFLIEQLADNDADFNSEIDESLLYEIEYMDEAFLMEEL